MRAFHVRQLIMISSVLICLNEKAKEEFQHAVSLDQCKSVLNKYSGFSGLEEEIARVVEIQFGMKPLHNPAKWNEHEVHSLFACCVLVRVNDTQPNML